MSSLPKPEACGQNWLGMQPTASGRLCEQCNKEIRDFSAKSWPEIVQTQAAHGNALCGMYSSAQLAYWGQSPPSLCARFASATALAFALSTVQAQGQTMSSATDKLILSGTVLTISAKGKPEPVPFATVLVAGTKFGTSTDEQGHYSLTLSDSVSSNTSTIVFSSIGFNTSKFTLPAQSTGSLQHDALLTTDTTIIAFSVRKPSLVERTKWTLKRWFGRD